MCENPEGAMAPLPTPMVTWCYLSTKSEIFIFKFTEILGKNIFRLKYFSRQNSGIKNF